MTGKRIDLCYEGRETADGRRLEPGALRFPDDPVPVTIYAGDDGFGSTLIGRATDFQRGDDGVVSGLVEITDMDPAVLDKHSVQIAVKDVKSKAVDGVLSISEATLMNVHLMPGFTNAWPDLDRRMLLDCQHDNVRTLRGHSECEDCGQRVVRKWVTA